MRGPVSKEGLTEFVRGGHIDEQWYCATYPDVADSGLSAAEHFLWLGARLGRRPHPAGITAETLPLAHGRAAGAGPLAPEDLSIDALFIDGTNGTSSTPYRVFRIAMGLAEQGWAARWIRGDQLAELTDRSLEVPLIVIHRAAYSAEYSEFVQRMRRRGCVIVFDIDDLIFDERLIGKIDGFRELTVSEQEGFVRAAEAHREFVLNADFCTAPTTYLVERMRELGKRAYRVRNAISRSNIEFFEQNDPRRVTRRSPFVIGYYSGTKTHQADFALVAPALIKFMAEKPDAVFRLVGELDLDDHPELAKLQWAGGDGERPRVTRVGLMPHDQMIRDQCGCDVIIAPLEVGNPFCESKSELKFFEAALAGCPVIASSTETFAEATENGALALLAATADEWLTAFRSTYDDYSDALQRASRAYEQVRRLYSQHYAGEEAAAAYRKFLVGNEAA